MIIAKAKTQEQETSNYFELFQPSKGLYIDGNEIDVLQFIGQYSLSDLNKQKESLLNEIEKIEEKITAIESLS